MTSKSPNSQRFHEAPVTDTMNLYSYTTDAEGNRLTETVEFAPDPIQEEGWYAAAADAGTAVWSEIYQWDDKPEVLSISSSYPVYDSNQIDHKKRHAEVSALTESSYFQQVQKEVSEVDLDEFWSS